MHIKPLMTCRIVQDGRPLFRVVECDQFRFKRGPTTLAGDTRAEAVRKYRRWAYGIRWRSLANRARREV